MDYDQQFRRVHVCYVSDDCGAQGMERNIGDQLNKAFEAYRQASIEKDNAKKDLQQMTEHYERYTQKLQKQIEDQQQLISKLKAQLMSSAKQASEENKLEPSPRKEEEETLLPCNHLLDSTGPSRRMQHRQENMDTGVFVAHTVPVNSSIDNKDMLEVFEAIQGKFQQIRSLTRRQKDHLKRFNGGNDTPNDQRFSMPIQCTDGTVEQAERPFPSALRSAVDIPHPPASLASRGTSPEDRDLVDSLTSLSVKFPPPADSEYEFLNSAPERHVGLAMPRKRTVGSVPASATAAAVVEEEVPVDVAMAFVYPTPPSHSVSSSTASLSQECVRGPQQPLWSPELCDAAVAPVDVETEPETSQGSSPDKCAFCHAVVPQDLMNSHLYSHFSPKGEESD